jgi:hypothetical protein
MRHDVSHGSEYRIGAREANSLLASNLYVAAGPLRFAGTLAAKNRA